MAATKTPSLEQPSLEELLPSQELRQAFDDKTAAFEAGRLVSDLRRSAKLTQVQLAARLGVTQARVSAVESGDGVEGPSFGLLKRIVLACGFEWKPHFGVAGSVNLTRENEPTLRARIGRKTTQAEPATMRPFDHPVIVSKELAAVIGPARLSQTEVVDKVWNYIKKHKLQNEANKREIVADTKLKAVFGKDKVTIFEMHKSIGKNLRSEHEAVRSGVPNQANETSRS